MSHYIEFLDNNSALKILIVEDNIVNQRIMTMILQKIGANCLAASNGEEAIRLMENNQFDVVLMDLNMPVMDGYETSYYIRNTLKSDVPIIALTADSIAGNESKYLRQGINAVLSKPFEIEVFKELMKNKLNKS